MVLLPVFYSYKIKACFLFPKSIKYCKNEQTLFEYFQEREYFGDNDAHARSAARLNIQRFRAKYGIFLATHDIWPAERYDSGKSSQRLLESEGRGE